MNDDRGGETSGHAYQKEYGPLRELAEAVLSAAKRAPGEHPPMQVLNAEIDRAIASLRAEQPPVPQTDETCEWSVTGTGSFRCILNAGHNGLHHVVFGDTEHFSDPVPQTDGTGLTKGQLPDVLFDGWAVYSELTPDQQKDIGAHNVSSVLNAVVRLILRQKVKPIDNDPSSEGK